MNDISGKSIAVITTGGTIGAAFGEGVTTLNHASSLLKQQIDGVSKKGDFDLHTFSPFKIFSEDMQPADWGRIMRQTEQCLQHGFKRIVITHGTDTMAYSATAAGLYYAERGAKICLTGAFYPPSDPRSDAVPNVEAALHFVSNDNVAQDVYVAFRQAGDEVALIRALDVVPMAADKTYFEGLYGDVAAFYGSGKEIFVREWGEPKLRMPGPAPTVEQLAQSNCNVIQIPCFPGMNLRNTLNLDTKKETLVILGGYHSGTMPAVALRNELLAMKESHPKTTVVLAMHPYRYVKSPYETTADLAKDGVLAVFRDIQPHQIHVLAVCETSKGQPLQNVLEALEPWRFGGPTREGKQSRATLG